MFNNVWMHEQCTKRYHVLSLHLVRFCFVRFLRFVTPRPKRRLSRQTKHKSMCPTQWDGLIFPNPSVHKIVYWPVDSMAQCAESKAWCQRWHPRQLRIENSWQAQPKRQCVCQLCGQGRTTSFNKADAPSPKRMWQVPNTSETWSTMALQAPRPNQNWLSIHIHIPTKKYVSPKVFFNAVWSCWPV